MSDSRYTYRTVKKSDFYVVENQKNFTEQLIFKPIH